MYKEKSFLAIIPARGGSKRLPRKNILPFAGKPLIGWSIDAALSSKYVDEVIVSSDDTEILSLANESGVEGMLRPSYLASDTATTIDVISHAVTSASRDFDYIVLLQATSPLRTSMHVDQAVETLFVKNGDSVVSVSKAEHSPHWMNTLPPNGSMRDFIREDVAEKRSQDFEDYYRLNGAIYIIETEKFMSLKSLYTEKTYAYIMPENVSVDIDTRYDFVCAEAIYKSGFSSGS